MKPPEEIKKELRNAKHVQCMDISDGENECARTNYGVLVGYVLRDAIYIYITQLESDNESKQKRIEQIESRLAQVERERDAAVHDLDHALREVPRLNIDCYFCKSKDKPQCDECFWEWRGVCAENTEEE